MGLLAEVRSPVHGYTGVGEQFFVEALAREALARMAPPRFRRHLHRDPTRSQPRQLPVVGAARDGGASDW